MCGPSGHTGCPAFDDGNYLDVVVDGTAVVDEVAMVNSAGSTPLYMNGTVMWSSFSNRRSTGPWIRGLSPGTLHDNWYQYNGTAGLRLSGTAGITVQRENLFENRWESGGGGQLYIDYDASNLNITNNIINGNNFVVPQFSLTNLVNGCYGPVQATGIAGIEIEPHSGYAGQNVVAGNEVFQNTQSGISVHSVASLFLSGYSSYPSGYSGPPDLNSFMYVHDNIDNAPPEGHATWGIEFLSTPNVLPYSSQNVTLSWVLSKNNIGYAVTFGPDSGASGPGWIGDHCLTISGGQQPSYVTSTGLTNVNPVSTGTCP